MAKSEYDPKTIESKWQDRWDKQNLHKTSDGKKGKDNEFILVEFAYPSGDLHVGHWYAFSVMDIYARFKRMQGKNVLFPMGFDAFGLPAENAAIKNKQNPRKWTYENINYMRKQLRSMGAMFDWSREVVTSDPEYYKWTQWLFLKLFENNLAYQAETTVNWCPSCKTVLANEQVTGGHCERCGHEVEQRKMKQWQLRITDYADRLISDLEKLDWPEPIKDSQKNWIGKSEGAEISFKLKASSFKLPVVKVFTTRPDTIFGTTYLVLSPEKALEIIQGNKELARPNDLGRPVGRGITNKEEIESYIKKAKGKTELERQENKEKTGVEIKGVKAVNPANKEEIPVWVADYVLGGYGTGAIMAVPAHDERDFKFAEKFNLPVKTVISPNSGALVKFLNRSLVSDWKDKVLNNYPYSSTSEFIEFSVSPEGLDKFISIGQSLLREGPYYFSIRGKSKLIAYKDAVFDIFQSEENVKAKTYGREKRIPENELSWSTAYEEKGILINSGKFDGLDSEKAKWEITKFVGGERQVQYKIRDWSVSRQRYWGVPIPVIYCDKCGVVPVPDKDLPVKLPILKGYRPKGVPPLASSKKFLEVKCPNCNSLARRDAETLDTFVDSSWYYLRYTDSKNKNKFADELKLKTWLPVKLYVIGA